MSNFVFGYDFIAPAITADSEDSTYPVSNLILYGNTKRHWRSQVITEVKIVFDYTSAKTLLAVALFDCNFTSVYIEGSADDILMGFHRCLQSRRMSAHSGMTYTLHLALSIIVI